MSDIFKINEIIGYDKCTIWGMLKFYNLRKVQQYVQIA